MSLTTASGLYELGKSLALQGQLKEADDKFKQAIEEILKVEDDDKQLVYKCYKARLDVNMDDETQRNEITSIMLDAFGSDDEYKERVLYDVAQCHKIGGDKVQYITCLEQIVSQFKQPQPYVYFELAMMQQDGKEFKKAVPNFLSYLNVIGKNHPNTQISVINLASCYNAIGQPERAQQALKRYLNIQ